jgi:hypothetical protein
LSSQTPPRATEPTDDYQPGETTAQWRARRHAARVATLLTPLSDVQLSDQDRRIIEWLADWDTTVVDTVASLFHRAHAAGRQDGHR